MKNRMANIEGFGKCSEVLLTTPAANDMKVMEAGEP